MRQDDLTFRDLDGDCDLPLPDCALDFWYAEVRDVKLGKMGVFDLARSCRQNVNVAEIIPFVFRELEKYLLAGELYDGELVNSLMKIEPDYWRTHSEEKEIAFRFAERAYAGKCADSITFHPDNLLRFLAKLL